MLKSVLGKLFKTEEIKKERKPIKKEVENNIKGSFGELRQDFRLERLPKENYKVINDIIIPNRNKTTQIDHLIISNYGIFVIENKNFGGNIYGNEYDKNWTQVMGSSKNKFYNPILQNYGHVKAIEEIIGDNKNIYSIVVFSDRAILRKIEIANQKNTIVINEKDLLNLINSHKNILFTDIQMNEIRDKVFKSMSKVSQSTIEHVQNINTNTDSDVCPRCSSKLVERKGKYGDFFGCSSYPKCKYTRKIE